MCCYHDSDAPAPVGIAVNVEIVPNNQEEDPIESDFETVEEPEDEGEHDSVIRAKWQMDGAKTLDEAVEKLEGFIKYLQALKLEGWELRNPIDDDWGFIYKKE